MPTVNMHEAKSRLSALVEAALAGEDVVIARAGKPVARLVAYRAQREAREPGLWRGPTRIAPDFDETPAELLADFEGGA